MSIANLQRPTEAFVDLDAVEFNFRSCKAFIGGDVRYMAVVKADAYGHGAARCAKRLETAGADWLAVALPEEGIELREAGIRLPILCLGSFWSGQERLLVDNSVTPVIYNESQATALAEYACSIDRVLDIHVKIDTGMGRLGVRFTDAANFAKKLDCLKYLRVTGLLTHFAAADDPAEDNFTDLQIDRFTTACGDFQKAGHEPEFIDLANSPGAIRHPKSLGNLVRLGGALYGLLDDILRPDDVRPDLKPVMTLRSRIAGLKLVPAGESIGYGRTFVARRDTTVALAPIGYADGYPRLLSNRGKGSIRGDLVPVVGRISMDWTLFDVTDLPNISVNDEITLIGGKIKASDLAATVGTIGYEITCGITKRVPRIYE